MNGGWPFWSLVVAGTLSSLAWLAYMARATWRARQLPIAEHQPVTPPSSWPLLSVVIPACNEVETLEPALATLRAQSYPALEILLVDDRSTDGTGALVDRLAAEDPRIRALHISELPAGWLGKVHALHVASREARGEWLLFTDADVHFTPEAFEHAVALALERGLDHLALAPDLSSQSFATNIVLSAFWFGILDRADIIACLDPDRPDAAGVGAFNLVRREVLERSEGFEWLRLEIADDFGLGLAVKRAGGRIGLMFSERWVKVTWYRNLGELLRGMTKNAFGIFGRFSFVRGIADLGFLLAMLTTPPALLLLPPGWFWAPPLLAYGAMVASGFYIHRKIGSSPWPVLLWPLGLSFFLVLGVNGMWQAWRTRGVAWRGTVYPLAELKAHRRVKL